jgi:hypothetical protein
MHRPGIEGRRAFTSEIMALIHAGYTPQLRRLMCQQLINNDAVKAESGQSRNAGLAEIVQTPGKDRCGHRADPSRVVSTRLFDRGGGSALGPALSTAYTETQPETPLQKPQICWLDIGRSCHT